MLSGYCLPAHPCAGCGTITDCALTASRPFQAFPKTDPRVPCVACGHMILGQMGETPLGLPFTGSNVRQTCIRCGRHYHWLCHRGTMRAAGWICDHCVEEETPYGR